MIAALNEQFLVPGCVECAAGVNGLPKAKLEHGSGSALEIYLYGAHITSWRLSGSSEILFLSRNAVFEKGKAIRGGIPVIFPQFGNGPLPAHGFARNTDWQVRSTEVLDDGAVSVTLALTESESSLSLWPFRFELHLQVILSDSLLIKLTVSNNSESSFSFQSALHTYFKVGDVSRISIGGLQGSKYIDKLDQASIKREDGSEIQPTSACDNVYLAAPDVLTIHDKSEGRKIILEKGGFREAVLWNPWKETGATIKDLHSDAYREMICLEAANVEPQIVVEPGELHSAWQRILIKPV